MDNSTVKSPYLSVVIPAYNEAERIGHSLNEVINYLNAQAYTYQVLVVDDGSKDSTYDIVTEAVTREKNLSLLHYDSNRGKGYAVRYGVLRSHGDFVLLCDADLATPIVEVENLLTALRSGSDIAIGSRDIPGARLERRQSVLREMGGKLFNRFVQAIAVPGIRDTQCGFKLFTQTAARNVFRRCRINDYAFDVEVLYVGRLLGYRIVEVPVRWAHQDGSKVHFVRDALRMCATTLLLKASSSLRRSHTGVACEAADGSSDH